LTGFGYGYFNIGVDEKYSALDVSKKVSFDKVSRKKATLSLT
jgi:hypothetical protein